MAQQFELILKEELPTEVKEKRKVNHSPLFMTGASMIVATFVYKFALHWSWSICVGATLLLFVHEVGHLIMGKKCNVKMSAPIFIPFIGAIIIMNEKAKTALDEARVGIAGPMLGTIGALTCGAIFAITNNPLFLQLTFFGLILNLFNLIPLGELDGGHIAQAISPKIQLIGLILMCGLLLLKFKIIFVLIILLSIPSVYVSFKKRKDKDISFYKIRKREIVITTITYIGLLILLTYFIYITGEACSALKLNF